MSTQISTLSLSDEVGIPPLLARCREALKAEAAAITGYAAMLDDEFLAALRLLRDARAPVVVSGIGKSGHIARKIASTFRSIGRPAVFVHPAEASHGDLGLVGERSVALILSNSGETAELSDLLHYCADNDVPIIAVTARATSTLGRFAEVKLAYGEVEEVCPNGLAPTTSTTLALAIGDALAVGLTQMLGTTPTDFRRYHPGGKLGARLLRVSDLMHTGDALPLVSPDMPMREVVITMSAKGFGIALVVDGGEVIGVITDGDMRRHADNLWQSKAGDLTLGPPQTIAPDMLAAQALERMSAQGITCLVVKDEAGGQIGLLHIHDCVRAGVKA